jgi:glycosyltransferase involved in cell wall biosynthesis
VSVIVPNYNLGRYLEQCVQALLAQTHPRIEVIVVDDGSTEPATLEALERLEKLRAEHPLQVIRKENGGVCRARNTGVAAAQGKYLAFVDADNLPRPAMVETLLRQLRHAGLDALTCDLYAFEDGTIEGEQNLELFHAFAGGGLEATLFMNTLGDANMLIRRQVFEALGGFTPARNESSADRAFLIRLLRRGFQLDCTNDCVFAYRRRPASMSRQQEWYWRAQCVREAYQEDLPEWVSNAMEAAFPIYKQNGTTQPAQDQTDYREKYLATRKKLEHERAKRRYQQQKSRERYSTLVTWRGNALVRLARFLKVIPRDY